MNIQTVRQMIRQAKGTGSIRALAARWGIDHTYLHRMMEGEREPSDDVLRLLGLERLVTYRRTKSK